jgi:hypothetical protein
VPTGIVSDVVFLDGAVCAMTQQPGWGSTGRIRCWHPQNGKLLRQGGTTWSRGAEQISAGCTRIAVADCGEVGWTPRKPRDHVHAIWDFATGKLLGQWALDLGTSAAAHPGSRIGFAISGDGGLIAEGGTDSVRLYRLP